LGKKFHSLRNASYKAREDEKKGFYWLAEHMLILEIEDIQTGQKKYVAGAFPSQSGKTNMAMMTPPEALRDNYKTRVISDDIAWLYVGKDRN
jgi:phosphoenolpyruvate carboxykinase (GTP)